MPDVILLCGKKRVGKDTAFSIIKEHYKDKPIIQLRLADPIKQVAKIIGFTDNQIEGDDKEVINPLLGQSFRTFAQEFGFRLRSKNEAIFVELLLKKLKTIFDYPLLSDYIVVVTDCRYQNEIDLLSLEACAKSILIERATGLLDNADSENQELGTIYKVTNNGTLDEFRDKLVKCLD